MLAGTHFGGSLSTLVIAVAAWVTPDMHSGTRVLKKLPRVGPCTTSPH